LFGEHVLRGEEGADGAGDAGAADNGDVDGAGGGFVGELFGAATANVE
jgi:hypothetical protein